MEGSGKRKTNNADGDAPNKKLKSKKQWRTPKPGASELRSSNQAMQPGDVGIYATCNIGKEGGCVAELRDLFDEYVDKMYGEVETEVAPGKNDGSASIEDDIKNEVRAIRKPVKDAPFTHVRLDLDCVVFFKTQPPIEPVSFVHRICADAAENAARKRSRFIKRLTPISLVGPATEKGLEEVCQRVLAPHFHNGSGTQKKFAIRPNIRNSNTLTRDVIIKNVAAAVGPAHKVDLKHYDLLILVEVHKNNSGMSVVNNAYEKLKRFNLMEIYEPAKADAPTG